MTPGLVPALSPRPATPADLGAILTLFDRSQRWLGEIGIARQWGTEPFSASPGAQTRFLGWIRAGQFYVVDGENAPVGTLALSTTVPEYAREGCAGRPGPALYLEALTTDPSLRGHGLGRALLAWAEQESARQGATWLRLDCWAGNARLRGYYREAGFTEFGRCRLGDWEGALFERAVRGSAGSA